jgi:hypothetical protein
MGLLMLLLIPLLVGLGFYIFSVLRDEPYSRYKITWKEFLIQVAIVAVLMTVGYYVAQSQSTSDVEVWNAVVAKKTKERVSCQHSYTCNCVTVACGKGCVTTTCQTCYEHSYDISWYVYTTAGEDFTIDRINRQGTQEPPRWTQVQLGDPTAIRHWFTNYIKANPWSLLNKTKESSKYLIPEYPLRVYDYHYIDRLVHLDQFDASTEWNYDLQVLNGSLGVEKKVNIIVVLTKESEAFSYALQNAWLGGKKNDLIIVIGSKDFHKIDWVRVVSWSHSEIVKVEVRDGLLAIGTLDDREAIMKVLDDEVRSGFVHMNMEDYKYLLAGMEPSETAMWILMVVGILISTGLSWVFYTQDIFR